MILLGGSQSSNGGKFVRLRSGSWSNKHGVATLNVDEFQRVANLDVIDAGKYSS